MILQGTTKAYACEGLTVNTRCRVEVLTDRPFEDVLLELAGRRRPRLETVKAFLAALLVDPVDEVDPVLKDVGGVPVIRKAAQAAWRASRTRRTA